MANQSILAAFERKWQYIIAKLSEKANVVHSHDTSDLTGVIATVVEVKAYLNI